MFFSISLLIISALRLIFHVPHEMNGTLCLSPEIASSLERFWGIPASFWLSLQSAYAEDLDNYSSFGYLICYILYIMRHRTK